MWSRIFAATDVLPSEEALLTHLQSLSPTATAHFRGDDDGWFEATLHLSDTGPTLHLACYLATEPGIRADLAAWAAWLETIEENPHHARLMQQIITTPRVFTLQDDPEEAPTASLCVALCQYLAQATAGVYQVDGRGFFAADGSLLVPEDPS